MADGERRYRVLLLLAEGETEPENPDPPRDLRDIGLWPGSTPEQAIEAAVGEFGMPREDRGRAVAVPESKWHERDVGKRMEPVFEVKPVAPPAPGGGEPDAG